MSHSSTMTPERWQRLQTLFDAALTLDPATRAEFIVTSCGDDVALREQVLSLVMASGSDDGFEQRVDQAIAATMLGDAELKPGHVIGRYKIIRLIGRGGMGAVYLAERADQEFEQRVAIKVVADGALSNRIVARLRSERQILANLNHPNIARLLDGGAASDGTPYLTMEYVDGQRIDRYCEDKQLTLAQRLVLFQQVCAAVQYAHQQLIIHRDIKPSNILVTADGVPKLLDFGIAKLVDPTATQGEALTRVHERVLTLEHASPEQVRGEQVGTPSDVYALGVLLYELLAGRKPYSVDGLSFDQMSKVICDLVPPKPSAAHEKSLQSKSLQGDLDTIVMKALHKDASRRYGSAGALADDIDHFLQNKPIAARPDSFNYRAGKFWRRNRWALSSATAVLIGVVTLTVFYTWKLTLERDNAQRERLTATRVSEFMTEVFRIANPNESRGQTVPVREVLDAAVKRIQTDLSNEPLVRSALMKKMAEAYIGIGLWNSAESLLQQVANEQRSSGAATVELANTLTALASIQEQLREGGNERKSLDEAWSIRTKLGADRDRDAIATLTALAINQSTYGETKQAIEKLQLAEQLANSLSPSDQVVLGKVYVALGVANQFAHDYDAAERYLRLALPRLRGTIEQGSDLYAEAVMSLVQNFTVQGRRAESQQLLRELLADQIKVLGPDHPKIATLWNYLGIAPLMSGDYEQARDAYQHVIDIQLKQPTPDPYWIGAGYYNLGMANHDAGDMQAAIEAFAHAQESFRKMRGGGERFLVRALSDHASMLREFGQRDAANNALSEAERLLEVKDSNAATLRGYVAIERGRWLLANKQYEKAATQLSTALSAIDPADQNWIADARLALGQTLLAQRQCPQAIKELRTAVAIRTDTASQEKIGMPQWSIAEAQNTLGNALSVCGDQAAAEPLLVASVAKLKTLRSPGDLLLADAERKLAAHKTSLLKPTAIPASATP